MNFIIYVVYAEVCYKEFHVVYYVTYFDMSVDTKIIKFF